ncbi:endo-1,3-alpha-glucanase family glycosylhydrolase [Mycobacterium sp.]|uniref:endo-1,3-alpha-glucanase family glycosylhydrolase n=1 Tax=Mycobacterium sp. TaxID=1785 RepID=UPI003D0D2F2F
MSRIFRLLSAWAAVLVLVAVLSLGSAPQCSYPTTTSATAATPYLPINLTEMHGPRKVFAHYMPIFPISIDNKDGDKDYYAMQYLTVDGESGKHAAYGGYLRDRPPPRPHSNLPDWQLADLRTEIGQAQSMGIDGFAVDVLATHATSNVIDRILRAATDVRNFTILITADMSSPLGAMTATDFAAEVAPYLTAPAAYHLSDGRPVLGAWFAERNAPEWWVSVFTILRDKFKLSVAFVPTFCMVADNPEKFAPFSDGFSMWGGRDPDAMTTVNDGRGSPVDVIRRTRQLGKLWMQPVVFQDSRPKDAAFEESDNSLTNRLAWQIADQQNAEWVQMVTWNDYAESTAMAPSVAHGWRILDMNAYDIAQFKLGRPPPIVRDALFVSYRVQPVGARSVYAESSPMKVSETVPPRDTIEVLAFATAPSRIFIRAGTQNYSCTVPAGRGNCVFPLSLGSISAEMRRNGAVVAAARSNADVTDTPHVQDLQYRVVGGLR